MMRFFVTLDCVIDAMPALWGMEVVAADSEGATVIATDFASGEGARVTAVESCEPLEGDEAVTPGVARVYGRAFYYEDDSA